MMANTVAVVTTQLEFRVGTLQLELLITFLSAQNLIASLSSEFPQADIQPLRPESH